MEQFIGDEDVFEDIELDLSKYHLALVMPPVHVSTGEAYRGVKPQQPVLGLKELVKLPVNQWQGKVKNDFEHHILQNHPQIRGVKSALIEAGALFSLMSGSGASVYAIFEKEVDLSFLEKDNLVFNGV